MDRLTPRGLLAQAQAAGLRVSRDGDRLVVSGPPTAESLALALLGLKFDVMPLVPDLAPPTPVPDHEVAWRAKVMRGQVPAYPRPLPLLLARPERPYAPGTCISCGDVVRTTRCEPCREAVRIVLGEWQRGGS